MAFTNIPALWAVGQKIKASVLNVMVNAILELQTASSATDAGALIVANKVTALEAVHFMERAQSGAASHTNGAWLAVPVTTTVASAGSALSASGSGIRINVTGRYYCEGFFTQTATTNRKAAGIIITSGPPVRSFTVPAVSGGLQIAMELDLTAGDIIYPGAYHDSGSTINTTLAGLIVRKLPA